MKEGQTQEPVGGIHELKIWPEYFDDVESGKKNFEVRKLDRLFGVGDILHLREWSLIKGYSGRETRKVITYVMAGGQWGLSEGNCILGIATPPPAPPIKTEGEDEKELAELRCWKESAMKVMADMQEIGKELGIKLGESIHDKILPAIINYKKSLAGSPPPSVDENDAVNLTDWIRDNNFRKRYVGSECKWQVGNQFYSTLELYRIFKIQHTTPDALPQSSTEEEK